MSDPSGEINLHLVNFPASVSGEYPNIMEVEFGVPDRVTVLVEIETETNNMYVTVGNGPEEARLNPGLAGLFQELADMFGGIDTEE